MARLPDARDLRRRMTTARREVRGIDPVTTPAPDIASAGRVQARAIQQVGGAIIETGQQVMEALEAERSRQITAPARALVQIRRKHRDVPAQVFLDLPDLVERPLFMIEHREGGLNIVLDATTAREEPIIVGIRDGQLRTVTPRHDRADGQSGRERVLQDVARALDAPGKVYARNAEALAEARASYPEQLRNSRAGRPKGRA